MAGHNPDFTLESLDAFVAELNDDNTQRLLRERRRTPARLGDGALRTNLRTALDTGLGRGDLEDQNLANR